MDDGDLERKLRLDWDIAENARRQKRFKWEEKRFEWEEKDRTFREANYQQQNIEQQHTRRFRYLNVTLQVLTLCVVFLYPLIREQYFLEDRIESVIKKTMTETSAQLEDKIQTVMTRTVREELAAGSGARGTNPPSV